MDLGGSPRAPLKRSQPPLERMDDPKRAKRVGGPAKLGAAPAPFDLANVLSGASDAARIRQQYAINSRFWSLKHARCWDNGQQLSNFGILFLPYYRDAASRTQKIIENIQSIFKSAEEIHSLEEST